MISLVFLWDCESCGGKGFAAFASAAGKNGGNFVSDGKRDPKTLYGTEKLYTTSRINRYLYKTSERTVLPMSACIQGACSMSKQKRGLPASEAADRSGKKGR